ncbi:hypothetical protein GO003_018425 [Methylicorpusculum oleiharenae]|uniref:hypothetical protein n=1 Tax=Methylicorpusculum oleiharenae TaxID=1338687 RepID=UPI0013574F1A|nr:hypothetical protein [Methylicorpusculum oleiharenae]MCD2452367.1 hypothetical protein [Methylicorpusculum oleiharenae]
MALSSSNPNHKIIMAWLDSLSSDKRGRLTAGHFQKALLDYIGHIKTVKTARQGLKVKNGSAGPVSKARKIEEKTDIKVLAEPVNSDVVYEDNTHKTQNGQFSSSLLKLINNSDFD